MSNHLPKLDPNDAINFFYTLSFMALSLIRNCIRECFYSQNTLFHFRFWGPGLVDSHGQRFSDHKIGSFDTFQTFFFHSETEQLSVEMQQMFILKIKPRDNSSFAFLMVCGKYDSYDKTVSRLAPFSRCKALDSNWTFFDTNTNVYIVKTTYWTFRLIAWLLSWWKSKRSLQCYKQVFLKNTLGHW